MSLNTQTPFYIVIICLAYLSDLGPMSSVNGQETVRIASFNVALNRAKQGQLVEDLRRGDQQARTVAEIIQRVAPDIVLLNEFDYDAEGDALVCFKRNYLEAKLNEEVEPITYPHHFFANVNTGVPTGFDLDHDEDAVTDGPADAQGYGAFPGQYAMVVLSRFPIQREHVRTFQKLLWNDMPDAMLPDDPSKDGMRDWYTQEQLDVLRLSSKSHWDVPIEVDGQVVHLLASHPTPPGFDGPENRNGRRNNDEIRIWVDYLSGGDAAEYLVDDQGRRGGLAKSARFVVVGDLNADPFDGEMHRGAISELLDHDRVNTDVAPSSDGGEEQAARQGEANARHRGPASLDTADFNDTTIGNLRVDYALPSRSGFRLIDAGVFWPREDQDEFPLVGTYPFPGSDHRLVYVDLEIVE